MIYVLTKELKITRLPLRFPLLILSMFLILVCAFLYSGTFFTYAIDSSVIATKLWLLRPVGVTFLMISLTVGILVTIVAEQRRDVDIEEISKMNMTSLDERVSKSLG